VNNNVPNAEQELRASLQEDLLRHLDRHENAGYIVAFVAKQMPLTLVEQLVDELDSVYGGQS
jgi:hypothetical protein